MVLGLCSNEGSTLLKRNDHLSIDIGVRPVENFKFLSTSVKYVTNVPNENLVNQNQNSGQKTVLSLLTQTSNIVQFQSVNSYYSQNCSSSFEKAFYELNKKEVTVRKKNT